MNQLRTMWLLAGLLVIPGLIGFLVALGITRSTHPESTQILFYPGLLLGVLVGTISLSMLHFRAQWQKFLAVVAYIPVMLATIWFLIYPWFHASGGPNI